MQDRDKIQKETPVFLDFIPPALRGSSSFLLEICVKHISSKKEFCFAKGQNLNAKGKKL